MLNRLVLIEPFIREISFLFASPNVFPPHSEMRDFGGILLKAGEYFLDRYNPGDAKTGLMSLSLPQPVRVLAMLQKVR